MRCYVSTPSAWYALQAAYSAHPKLREPLRLEAVVPAGEALDPPRLQTWVGSVRRTHPAVNAYGPTEATVYASFRRILEADIAVLQVRLGCRCRGGVVGAGSVVAAGAVGVVGSCMWRVAVGLGYWGRHG
ncbi:hypothetical protein [Mycobacterium kansasii]|uniref:hypothetical protein n=1 Tax=Mycobacterium kansasii TaxID=1768 RepID=UPI0019101042|nr:hypothetical protein [Mycobacterium kansasii]